MNIPDAASEAIDSLTSGYRLVAENINSLEPGIWSFFLVWLAGSLITIIGLMFIAFIWHAIFGLVRRASKEVLRHATLGIPPERIEPFVETHVRFDAIAARLQRLSGVTYGSRAYSPSDPKTRPNLASRIARLPTFLRQLLEALLAVLRWALSTPSGILSLFATWWATGHQGLLILSMHLTSLLRSPQISVSTLQVSIFAALIALATFLLGRLRTERKTAQSDWRKSETVKAIDDISEFQWNLRSLILEIRSLIPDVALEMQNHLRAMDAAASRTLAIESKALRRSIAAKNPEALRERKIDTDHLMRNVSGFSTRVKNHSCETIIKAMQDFYDTASSRDERLEYRMARNLPWKIARLGLPSSLLTPRYNILKIQFYTNPAEETLDKLGNFSAKTTREIIQETRASMSDDTDSEKTEQAWIEVVTTEWRAQIDEQLSNLQINLHHDYIDFLIGVTKLSDMDEKIDRFLYPKGLLARLRELLLPA